MDNSKVVDRGATHAGPQLDSLARTDLESELGIERVLARRPATLTYLAHENRKRRSVVLRVVDRRVLEDSGNLDALQASLSELAAIAHPGIVPLYEFGLGLHCVWWTAQFVDAPSLADVVRREGPLSLERVLQIAKPVADALLHAHHHGLAHGGVTLDALLIRADDWAVITDFVRPETWLQAGVAPETTAPSPGTDQRALAVAIYRCLIGDVDRPTANLVSELQSSTTLAARRPKLPPSVAAALVRGADAASNRQFASVAELVAALGPGAPETPAPRTPPVPAILVPEPAPSAEPSTRSERRLIVMVVMVVVAFSGLWFGLARWLTSPSEPDQPTAFLSPDSAVVTAPPPAPVPVTDSVPTAAPPALVHPPRRPSTARAAPVRTNRVPTKPPTTPPAALSARLLVRAVPGGTLYIDDRLIGPAIEIAVPVAAGRHVVKVTKPGYRRYLSLVDVAPGEERRLTDVVLEPEK